MKEVDLCFGKEIMLPLLVIFCSIFSFYMDVLVNFWVMRFGLEGMS
jgi:hypothetical protein